MFVRLGRLEGQSRKIRRSIWVGSSLPKPYRKYAYGLRPAAKYEPIKPIHSFYFSCGLRQSMNRPIGQMLKCESASTFTEHKSKYETLILCSYFSKYSRSIRNILVLFRNILQNTRITNL